MTTLMEPVRRVASGNKAFLGAIQRFEDDLRPGEWTTELVDMSRAPIVSLEHWPDFKEEATGYIERELGRPLRYPIDWRTYVFMRACGIWEDSYLVDAPEPGRVYYIPASFAEMSGLRKTVSLESAGPVTTPEETAWILKIPDTGLSDGWRSHLLLMQAVTWQQKKTDPAAWNMLKARVKRTMTEEQMRSYSSLTLELEHRLVVHALPHGSIAGRTNPFDSIEDMEVAKKNTIREFEEAFGPPLSGLELGGRKAAALWAACALLCPSLRDFAEQLLSARL